MPQPKNGTLLFTRYVPPAASTGLTIGTMANALSCSTIFLTVGRSWLGSSLLSADPRYLILRPFTPPSRLARSKRAWAPSSARASDWPEPLVLSTSPSIVIESALKPCAALALFPALLPPLDEAPELGVELPPPLELLPQAASASAKEAPSATNAVFRFSIVPPRRAS